MALALAFSDASDMIGSLLSKFTTELAIVTNNELTV